jgi:hypothetical protein
MLLLLFVQFNMMIDEHDAIPGCYDKPSCFSRTPIHVVCCYDEYMTMMNIRKIHMSVLYDIVCLPLTILQMDD